MSAASERLAQIAIGAALVLTGGIVWATQNADAAGAAMIGVGGAMLPSGINLTGKSHTPPPPPAVPVERPAEG